MSSLPSLADVQAAAAAAAAKDGSTQQHTAVWMALVKAAAASENTDALKSLLEGVSTWAPSAQQALVDVVWLQTSAIVTEEENNDNATKEKAAKVTTTSDSPNDHWRNLVQTLATAVPALKPRLLATLEAQWLTALVPEAELTKKVRQVNTQHYYKQYKYNVMAEVSEGYAKWLSYCRRHISDDTQEAINRHVMELIGTFALDPSRCLDVALDVLEDALWEQQQQQQSLEESTSPTHSVSGLMHIIQCLQTDKFTPLVAFKLRSAATPPPPSLLHCVVYLLNRKLLDISTLLTYLPEWYDVLQTTMQAHAKRERLRLKGLAKVRLSSSGTDDREKGLPVVDLQPLHQHTTTHIITAALPTLLPQLQTVLTADMWSDLVLLCPDSVGGPLLDAVTKAVQPHLPSVWPSSSDDDDDKDVAMQEDTDNANTAERLLEQVTTLLSYTHPAGCLVNHPILMGQLWRLVAKYLDDDVATEACLKLLRTILLPTLSALPSNPAMSNLAWQALQLLPCRQRYALYAMWKGAAWGRSAALQGTTDKPSWWIEAEVSAEQAARYALKRLSKDTVREQARALGKIAHGTPLVVFSIMLATMEMYDNMIDVMVEALRFVGPLSLDVLCFCILQRLAGSMGGVNRSRLKEDGVNVSQWLQSLETFIGRLCRQFPALEVRGIISYLILRLRKGEVMELGVLRALLKMAGGWAFSDASQAAALAPVQLQGRAGSTLLKREIMSFGVHEDFSAEASTAIRRMLQKDHFGTTILILLAQVQHQIIFEDGKGPPKPIKLIGNLVDLCQATMAILLDFVTDSAAERSVTDGKPPEATLNLAVSMPSLLDLIENFELDLSSLWMICRPLVRAASHPMDDADTRTSSVELAKLARFRIDDDVRKAYKSRLPEATWSRISGELYENFYCNTLFDIFLPDDSYKTEITRLEKEVDSKTKSKNESDTKDLARMKKTTAQLSSDWNKQRHHVESVRRELKAKAKSFFTSDIVTKEAMTIFFTTCIFPRCMQGPDDALYCVHFIAMLHSFDTPGFGTLQLYDLMIVSLSRAVFGLTEGEAANVAILLESLWKNVSRWRYDDECFAEEMHKKVGCSMVEENEEIGSVTSETYAALYNKWHASLGGSMLGCLQSTEYMHCRNSLTVLSRMVEVYPTRPTLANRLLSALEPLQDESYSFADIRASAQAYGTQLIRARDDGVWKEETEQAKKARKAKEKAAAAARQKKAEEQMQQMQRDSEKITEEIGEKESYDQRRQPGRGPPRGDWEGDRRGPPPPREERGRRGDGGGVRPLEDRWQRAEPPRGGGEGGRGSKRSRGPSPADPADDVGGRASKRQRSEAEDGAIPDEGARRSRRGRNPRR